jgi:glutathione S-transferase
MPEEAGIVFYHAPRTRSSVVHWMLEELGCPYRVERLSLERGEHKQPDYLAINPMGKVPAIVHDGVVVTEVAAICCHLADAFPQAGLAVPIGDRRRGSYLRWLFFAPGCLEPAITDRMLKREPGPSRMLGYGDFETTLGTLRTALVPGPYLLGDRFTTVDIVLGAGVRWARMAQAVSEDRAIDAYIARLEARPALQRATERDALGAA